jgi:hypothetical protein
MKARGIVPRALFCLAFAALDSRSIDARVDATGCCFRSSDRLFA